MLVLDPWYIILEQLYTFYIPRCLKRNAFFFVSRLLSMQPSRWSRVSLWKSWHTQCPYKLHHVSWPSSSAHGQKQSIQIPSESKLSTISQELPPKIPRKNFVNCASLRGDNYGFSFFSLKINHQITGRQDSAVGADAPKLWTSILSILVFKDWNT